MAKVKMKGSQFAQGVSLLGAIAETAEDRLPGKFWDIERHGVTQSLLGLFTLCPEKARLRFQEGLKPDGMTGALQFGDLFHRSLDGVYNLMKYHQAEGNPVSPEDVIEGVVDQLYFADKARLMSGLEGIQQLQDLELNSGMARVMLEHYFKQWRNDYADFSWVDIERVFEANYDLTGPDNDEASALAIPVRGKYDGVFRDRKGKLWLFETKTKSQVDDNSITDKLSYDLQVMLYMWTMIQVYGEVPQGVVYNIVRRPQLRIKVKETLAEFLQRISEDVDKRPEHYFIRYNATVLPEEIYEWASRDLDGLMAQLWKWSRGEFNYRNSGSCNMWNRPCEFMRTCAYGDKSRLKVQDVVFPELQPETIPDGLVDA